MANPKIRVPVWAVEMALMLAKQKVSPARAVIELRCGETLNIDCGNMIDSRGEASEFIEFTCEVGK